MRILLLLFFTVSVSAESFKITSFNIQRFGDKKLRKTEVTDVIAKILMRADVVLIQEYQINDLNEFDNFVYEKLGDKFSYDISERLGSSTYLESFAVLYDKNRLKLQSFTPLKLQECKIARNPYIAVFDKIPVTMLVVHLSPARVEEEITCLEKSIQAHPENLLIVGDFNADCHYWKPDYTRFRGFAWLLKREDTTVGKSRCTYDRAIYRGKFMTKTNVFYFDHSYGLTIPGTKRVSDHYPVEIDIKVIE